MEKEFYEVPEMEVTSFEMTDIIAASDPLDDDETDIRP